MNEPTVHVRALEGAKEDFFRRHRKDQARAIRVWQALLAKSRLLENDPDFGDAIQRDRWPRQFHGLSTLKRLALPEGFRALYTVFQVEEQDLVVRIDWVGDHREYDRLFGYSTS